jgi:hypothetical protein
MYGRFDGSLLPLVRQKKRMAALKRTAYAHYFGLLVVVSFCHFLILSAGQKEIRVS